MPAVDEGLDERVKGLLDGRSDEDRLVVALAFKRFGRVGPVTGCVARRHTCLKMVPANRPPGVEQMRPIGGSDRRVGEIQLNQVEVPHEDDGVSVIPPEPVAFLGPRRRLRGRAARFGGRG